MISLSRTVLRQPSSRQSCARSISGWCSSRCSDCTHSLRAQHATRTALPEEMRRVFASPVPYTLNSLRIEPASKDKLVARVLVKNQPTGSGIAQEKLLEPEVQGGTRARKRSEQAMGYQGVLSAGNYAMPGHGMALDEVLN